MTRTVPGYGPETATWAIVGEAPGATEDREGRPFVGRSGQLLRETLERAGLNPDEAYITNVVKERPPNNATPTAKQIREAAPALAEELLFLPNLRAVLLLGNTPLNAVSGKGGVTKRRGTVKGEKEEFEGPAYFCTLHPAAVLRNQNHFNEWLKDLSAFQQLVDPPQEDVTVHIVDSDFSCTAFLEQCRPSADGSPRLGAIDIETTVENNTVNPWVDPIELVSVAVSFHGGDAWVLRNDEYLRRAKWALQDCNWIMHNGMFDRLMMRYFGYDLTLKHDTMAMAYLLHEEERKGLEVLSSVWLGLPPYKGVDYDNILDEPFEKVAQMNAIDASRTYKLFKRLAQEINQHPNLSRIYQWLLLPAMNTLIRLTENGVPVDQARLKELGDLLQIEQEKVYQQLQETTPDPNPEEYPDGWPRKRKSDPIEFNPNSSKQVGHILFDVWGLPVVKSTDSGAPSSDKDSLTQLQDETEDEEILAWIDLLLTSRELNKQLSSYINSWPALIDPEDRMHPRYKPLHVVTGRLSSENPNIQQVPRDKRFRSVFGGVEGHTWLKADYSQIELRLAAWHAEEIRMLQAYDEGADVHRLTAQLVLGDESDEARQVGKTLNFGLLYGAGARTLQRIARTDYGLHLDYEEARMYREQYFQAYPGLLQWHRDAEDRIIRTGQSVSPLGRVRHLPDAQGWDEGLKYAAVREGINHPIQSFASDMLLMSLHRVQKRLDDEGLGARLIVEVHDEMDLLVPDAEVDTVAEIVKTTMEDVSWVERWGIALTVPVLAEVEIGPYWGELTEWKEPT